MKKLSALVVVIALVSSMAMATQPNAPARYHVNRDTCVIAGESQNHVNLGGRDHSRAGKGDANSGEQPLLDWDMAGVIQPAIDAELLHWGKTLQQAMDLDMINIRHEISGPTWIPTVPEKEINLQTCLSTNDWWESDGTNADLQYNWSSGYGATWMYAGDSLPFGPTPISWMSPINGELWGEFRRLFWDYDPGGGEPLVPRGTVNSTIIVGLYPTTDADESGTIDASEIIWSGADLDEAFWYELIYDDNCVGTRQFGTAWASALDPPPPSGNAEYDNVSMCHLGQWAGIAAASLVIEVKPHDGDAQPDGAVNLSDLIIVANNWQGAGKQWEEGDFTGEGDVNLSDLIVVANEWNWVAGGAGGAVPEPASLVVLGLGALALVRRRRRRT